MAYNEKLAGKIREALAHFPIVKEKKMFGSLAFMVNGKLCITVGKDRIMCRIDPATNDEAINHEGVETVKMRGRDYKGYVYINEQCIQTQKELNYWISQAIQFNETVKSFRQK